MLRVSALDFVCTFYGKKINITFKSIWFRFNFSSFFLVSYRCFIRQYSLVRQREKIDWKNSLSKKWKEFVKTLWSYVIWLSLLKNMHFPHSGANKFNARQVQADCESVVFFPFISQWKMQFCSWCSFNCNLFTLTIDMNMREKKKWAHNMTIIIFATVSTTFTYACSPNRQYTIKTENYSPVSVKPKCVIFFFCFAWLFKWIGQKARSSISICKSSWKRQVIRMGVVHSRKCTKQKYLWNTRKNVPHFCWIGRTSWYTPKQVE